MSTAENDTTQNPIRIRFKYGGFDSITALRLFKNQIPGTVVVDTTGSYYKCSKWKTSKGEPIWAKISFGGLNLENYSIFVNYQVNGVQQIRSSKSVYTDPVLIRRLRSDVQSAKVVGHYFFQQLSSAELKRIKTDDYTIGSFLQSEQYVQVDDFPSMTMRSLQALNEKYEYMRTDSNGRSGFGATQNSQDSNADDEYDDAVTRAYLNELQRTNTQYEDAITRSGNSGSSSSGSGSGSGSSSGSGSGSGASNKNNNNTKGGSTKKTKGKKGPQATTTVVLKPDIKTYTGSNDFGLPYMKQVINHFNAAENSRQRIERIHVFEMIPNSFEFTQLSSQWNEVARSGNYPLVDWSNYNLTKVSFRFLVVAKKLETNEFYTVDPVTKIKRLVKQTSSIVNDGLLVSIDDQLDNIRAMAGAPTPVTLYNLNSLLSTEYRYPYTNNTRNIQWVIGDASITATRLTADGKAISAAEVSITLTEYPVVAREIIPLPPLRPDNPPPPPCKPDSGDPKCTPVDPVYGLWVGNTYKFLNYVEDAVTYPTGKPS